MAKKKAHPVNGQRRGRLRCRQAVAVALAALLALGNLLATGGPVAAISTTLVISQFQVVGSTGADEFIELHNVGSTSVDLNGQRVVYRRPFVTTDVTLFSWSTSTVIPAGGYYLIAHGTGYDDSVTPDGTYNLSGTGSLESGGGGLAIRNGDENTGAITDSVGYGSANNGFTETTLVSTPSSGTRQRKPSATTGAAGCVDSDDNFNDFESPSSFVPRNSGTAAALCTFTSTPPSGRGTANPNTVDSGDAALLTVAVTPGTYPDSTEIAVTGDLTAIGGSATQQFYDDATNGDLTTGDNTFSYNATVAVSTSVGAKSLLVSIADAESRSGSTSIALTVTNPRTLIHDIQGMAHISPLNGQTLTNVQGIVTAKRSNGFYMQERDADADADPATSEAILVFTGSAPVASVGDAVIVGGTVTEFRPGGTNSTNLTITEISTPGRFVVVESSGNPLPSATVIGTGGRIPPPTIIDDDTTGSVELTTTTFDPTNDGIDFYESLEGMLVQVNNAVAVGPTNDFGELAVLADNGANGVGTRTARGGIVIQPGDFNPERIILDDAIIGGANMPKVSVGTTFPGAIVGVLDFDFGNFKFLPTANLPAANIAGVMPKETTPLTVGANQLTVVTFNVENLDPGDPQAKFDALAGIIVNNLRSPDIIALEEIQDNNGATNDSVVEATTTYNALIDRITAVGGPTYQFRQINPVDDQDGGEPGGNIRVGFLFRTDRGVGFVDRAGGTATAAVGVTGGANGPELTFSPGRIAPTNSAFNSSRKPLAAEFTFNGQTLFLVANHFNSKGGDQPLFGRFQPPTRSSEVQREQQATIVRDFVDDILALDADANVIVLGDINDFQFSNVLTILEGSGTTQLHTLIESLPLNEQYSYVFDGNSQALDHILVSPNLFNNAAFAYDIVHVNAEFSPQDSDHDPQLVRLTLAATTPPIAGDVSQNVTEDMPQPIAFQGTATNGGTLVYSIVAGPTNGTLGPIGGNEVVYRPNANYSGPDSFTYKVTEKGVDSAIATVSITVSPVNDAPIASDGNATAGEDTGIEITLVATDAENSPLTYTIITPPTHGTLGTVNGNKVVYTPAPNYTGPDSFTFKANDGTVDSNIATVTLTVEATNDPPQAGNGAATTPAGTAVTVALTATDPEGAPLTYSVVTPPAHGTLGPVSGNQVTYTPATGYSGPDTFTFRASDGTSNSNVATVSIAVLAPPPPPTLTLTVATTGGGTVTPGTGQYPASDTVMLTATANAGSTFIGWAVDGAPAGFANPLAVTMNAAHTVQATFAATPAFSDIAGTPYEAAIVALAAYGAILGYGDGTFGPSDELSRAQMAALIARAMGWRGEDHGNPFTDRNGIDAELWRSVGTLAFYSVAFGYGDGTFGPNDDVSSIQSISFITRAMVAKGYWVRAQADDGSIYPNVPATSSHRLDLVTFVQHAGQLPQFANDATLDSWNQPATRGWYAAALLQALESRFATTP